MTTTAPTPDAPVESASIALNRRAGERGERRMLIGGELREGRAGLSFDNISPATGQVIGSTAAGDADDMDAAIAAARTAFDETGWSTDRALRKRCLLQLQEALEAEREELREELVAEAGSPLMTTYMAQLDWPLTDALRWPAEMIDSFAWSRDLGPGDVTDAENRRVVWKEPIGVVGAIVPWNFPFELVLNKLGQSLATGNTVVLKPDPNTPWTSTRIGRLVAEKTDIPAGVLNVVTAPENSVAEMLVTDRRVDMVSFTGSTDVGRLIAEKAAATLKRVFLELGGKSAMVFLDDADIDATIFNCVQVCLHAGQGCALSTRALVPAAVYDDFVVKVTALLETFAPGDPANPDTFLGPVVNRKQLDRIAGYVDRARASGAEITTGGSVAPVFDEALAGGNFYLPTVVAGIDNSNEIAQSEVFGPVLAVLPYTDTEDALRIANDSTYGLSGMVFSGSQERALDFSARVRTGTLNVNGGVFYGADAPYGGYKASGLGRQCGVEGFEQYLETKLVAYR